MSKEKVVDFRTKEQKKVEFKEKLKAKFRKSTKWLSDNKEWLIPLMPVAFGSIKTVSKVVGRRVNLHKEENLKNLYCYDRSLGHYWRLRRELTNKEWLEVTRRKNNVEKLADILSKMKVLK